MPNAATNSDELVVLTTTNSDELVASEEAISNDGKKYVKNWNGMGK